MLWTMNSNPKLATFSVDEFEQLARSGGLAGKPAMELLDGVIYQMNPQRVPHANLKMALAWALREALKRKQDLVVTTEVSVRLSEASAPLPDVVVWRKRDTDGFVEARDVQLIIEVADSSLRHDLTRKRDLYAAAQIPEYWVADVDGQVIHQFAEASAEGYTQKRSAPLDRPIALVTLPDVTLALDV
jgi:Uma2 family endonuclease